MAAISWKWGKIVTDELHEVLKRFHWRLSAVKGTIWVVNTCVVKYDYPYNSVDKNCFLYSRLNLDTWSLFMYLSIASLGEFFINQHILHCCKCCLYLYGARFGALPLMFCESGPPRLCVVCKYRNV